MINIKFYAAVFFACYMVVALSGCAEIEPPTPGDIISHPLGKDTLRVGMNKEEVMSIWGEADVVNKNVVLKPSGKVREEWIYHGRYSDVPLDTNNFSKTRHLYFDGNNLTEFR